jgi:formylglycine-generating enzyme required for sulfatase activity/serine/threonine protein kinase
VSVLEPGIIFGRDFRIVKALRSGGMGAVYIADQLSTGKERALKVMAPELAADPATRERFVLEARAASKIESDHVVEIVTAGVDDETGACYLVMELLKGEELGDCVARLGPLPLGDVAEILEQVGHALEQAHQHGIVHRDLKPENIFLCASRRRDVAFTAKILDFGIAKLVAEGRQTGTQPLGTPLFMAPEQTERRGRICPATDVWALGLIVFFLLTGQHFWRDADALPALLREICVDDIPFASVRAGELASAAGPPLATSPSLPPGFDAWFARCVNRDIDARFQDAGEAVRAFAELLTVDAPRGILSMGGRASSPGVFVSGSTSGQKSRSTASLSTPVRVSPVGTNPRDMPGPNAPTVGATGNAFMSAGSGAPEAAGPKKRPFVALIAVALALAGAAGAFLLAGGVHPKASPVHPASAPALPPPAATAASAAPCPDGMVLIEGGKMFMGARDLNDAEKPPHEVTVSTFCLDKTEVTTRAYLACVEKGECERPLDHVRWNDITQEQEKRFSPLCNATHLDRGNHPINCVAWAMADNYCNKNVRRLPTEAEWEFAARGSSQRKYPWGDSNPSANHLNACGKECRDWGDTHNYKRKMMHEDNDSFPATAPVGSFPMGASSHGVLDLAGNVWEWTADWFAPYTPSPEKDPKGPKAGTQRVLRGGDFFGYEPEWARPAYRWRDDPETYNHAIGFRCAADPR